MIHKCTAEQNGALDKKKGSQVAAFCIDAVYEALLRHQKEY